MSQQKISFFEDHEHKLLRPTLFSEDACREAKAIYHSRLKSSQFRNYFQELRGVEARFKQQERAQPEMSWGVLLPQLHMMKAKLAYGMRKQGSITPEFRNFMDRLIDSGMGSAEEFKAMMLYLESVLAYFYAHENNQGGC